MKKGTEKKNTYYLHLFYRLYCIWTRVKLLKLTASCFVPNPLKVRFFSLQQPRNENTWNRLSAAERSQAPPDTRLTRDMTHWPNDWFHEACVRRMLIYSRFSSYRTRQTKTRLSGAILRNVSESFAPRCRCSPKLPLGADTANRRNKGETALCRGWRDRGEGLRQRSGSLDFSLLLQHPPLPAE